VDEETLKWAAAMRVAALWREWGGVMEVPAELRRALDAMESTWRP